MNPEVDHNPTDNRERRLPRLLIMARAAIRRTLQLLGGPQEYRSHGGVFYRNDATPPSGPNWGDYI
ncbi:MAG TPA: hypothetical protein VGS28_04860 [Candidatus Saccharimonadales bacterium]|nr:hypothetical protein [Candidatus Saccharimonadales bacterium]